MTFILDSCMEATSFPSPFTIHPHWSSSHRNLSPQKVLPISADPDVNPHYFNDYVSLVIPQCGGCCIDFCHWRHGNSSNTVKCIIISVLRLHTHTSPATYPFILQDSYGIGSVHHLHLHVAPTFFQPCMHICIDFCAHSFPFSKQEAQLMLTTGSTRLAVSRGQQTWYHSTCYI